MPIEQATREQLAQLVNVALERPGHLRQFGAATYVFAARTRTSGPPGCLPI
jgi:hypothetical protein